MKFVHQQLDRPGEQIRLLQFENTEENIDFRLLVKAFDLTSAPPYVALSYEWGDSDSDIEVIVNSARHQVRYNLYLFFCEFRKKIIRGCVPGDTWLWIDALCIDQNETIERNAQVSMMANIYDSATRTLSWLGWSDNGIEASTFDFITGKNLLLNRSHLLKRLQGVLHLCTCSYFQRRWIIQEIFWSRLVTLCWGQAELRWEVLVSFLHLFSRAVGHDPGRPILYPSQFSLLFLKGLVDNAENARPMWEYLRESPAFKLANETRQVAIEPGGKMTRSRPLLALLQSFRRSQCEIPADRVYALLSMAEEEVNFPVDYSLPFETVCCRTLELLRRVTNPTLDMKVVFEPLGVEYAFARTLARWFDGEPMGWVKPSMSRLETVNLAVSTTVKHMYIEGQNQSSGLLHWLITRLGFKAAKFKNKRGDCASSRHVLSNLPTQALEPFLEKLVRRFQTWPLCRRALSYLLHENIELDFDKTWSGTFNVGDSRRVGSRPGIADCVIICEDGSLVAACAETKPGDLLCIPPCFQGRPAEAPSWMVVRRDANEARLVGAAACHFTPYVGRCPNLQNTITARLDPWEYGMFGFGSPSFGWKHAPLDVDDLYDTLDPKAKHSLKTYLSEVLCFECKGLGNRVRAEIRWDPETQDQRLSRDTKTLRLEDQYTQRQSRMSRYDVRSVTVSMISKPHEDMKEMTSRTYMAERAALQREELSSDSE